MCSILCTVVNTAIYSSIIDEGYYVMFALCGRKSVCRLSVVCNTGATEGLTFRQYFTPSYSLGTRFVLKFCKETRRIFG